MRLILILMLSLALQVDVRAQLVPQDVEKVRLNLGWSPQFQFAGYYAAQAKGFFIEEGIEVELVATIQEDIIGSVLNDQFQYGIATGGVILSDDRYNQLSVVAAIYQQSPVALISLKSGNIRQLKDTEGRDVLGG